MADEKKPAADAPSPDPGSVSQPTPRPDPVGERNYRLSQPVVRPVGEGTPGAMRQAPPVDVTPAPAVAPKVDAVMTNLVSDEERQRRLAREESEKRAHAPVPPAPPKKA